MADPSKYILKVTGGPHYSDKKEIHVNTSQALGISSEHIDACVHIRIKDFRGLPTGSPPTCSYFNSSPHTNDRYSISFTFTPKTNINGNDLVFGNDFDHPIKDKLPPLFDKAFSIVKGWIDPGLYGDPYADEPYLYGPLLSSVNVFRIGDVQDEEDSESGPILEEGAHGEEAEKIREEKGLPASGAARMKFFLSEEKRKDFEFKKGTTYSCDFFNPYLDFNEFALRLPMGFKLNILGSWDGQPLRYVMRNRKTDELLFVVNFALIPIDKEGTAETGGEEKKEVNAATAEGSDSKFVPKDDDLD